MPEWECAVPKWYSVDGPYRLSVGAIVMFEQGDTIHDVYHEPFGANMALHRSAFDRYGRFRTDLGPVGRTPVHGEDTEFCQRLLSPASGYSTPLTPLSSTPSDGKRVSKAYYRTWYFWSGVRFGPAFTKGFNPPSATVEYHVTCFANAARAVRWLVAVDPKRRFYHQLRTFMRIGEIWEFWRQWRDVKRKTGASHDLAGQSACGVLSSPGTWAHGSEQAPVNDYSDTGTQRMGTDATVIICTHNRADRLASVLADLRVMDVSPAISWEIIVADNGSSDNTKATVERARAASSAPVRYHYEKRKGKSYALTRLSLLPGGSISFSRMMTSQSTLVGFRQSCTCFRLMPALESVAAPSLYGNVPCRNGTLSMAPDRVIGAVVQFEQGDTLHEVEGYPYPVG